MDVSVICNYNIFVHVRFGMFLIPVYSCPLHVGYEF